MGMLAKIKNKHSNLPPWVLEAFASPKQLPLADYRRKRVIDVFGLMVRAEVYAGSPQIEELDGLINDEGFMEMFEKFLLGHNLGEKEYEFSWQEAQRRLREIKASVSQQCYFPALAESIREMANPK